MPPHSATPVVESGLTPIAYESLTVANAAKSCTAGTYGDATHAEMTLENAHFCGSEK